MVFQVGTGLYGEVEMSKNPLIPLFYALLQDFYLLFVCHNTLVNKFSVASFHKINRINFLHDSVGFSESHNHLLIMQNIVKI